MQNLGKLLYVAVFAVVIGLLTASCEDPAGPGGKPDDKVVVTSVTLDQKTLKLTIGDSPVTLSATVLPETAADKSVTWESSDETIATVTNKGKVTPVAIGKTVITVTTNSGGKTAKCTVTVSGKPDPDNPATVDSVTLDQNTLDLTVGDTAFLSAIVEPETAADKSVIWESSDETIATVSEDGEVTAIAAGEAIISVTTNDGNFIDDCMVTVTAGSVEPGPIDPVAVTGVTLNKNTLTLYVASMETLIATVQPETAADKTVTWSTSAAGVATVSTTGTVTTLTAGTAIITVTTTDGGFTAQCAVTVNPVEVDNPGPGPIAVTGVTLNKTATALIVGGGGTETLTATVAPANATNKEVTWGSSNTAIATVTGGTVAAVGAGTATITVTTTDGNFTASCTVTVNAAPVSPVDELPVLDTTIPFRSDQMFFQFNNKTKGQYSDDEIYIVILGMVPRSGGIFSYVNKNGQMIQGDPSLNTIRATWTDNRMVADVSFKLSDTNHVYMPNIESGRMYISYGKPVYIAFHTGGGFAGPDINNGSDPNRDTLFEFIEFTIEGQYHGNTTRVDFFSFPIVTRLYGQGGYDQTVGERGTRAELFAAFNAEVPAEFKTLITEKRILAPCKGDFNTGRPYANYFQAYIDQLWTQWTNNEAVFNCGAAGIIRGRVGNDNVLRMVRDGHQSDANWGNIEIRKPNTQEVLEGKGPLAEGNDASKVVQAQLCAAINRAVAHLPTWGPSAANYYQQAPANFYSKFWHDHSIGGHAYGFCYDDVFDHATLLHHTKPQALVMDLKW